MIPAGGAGRKKAEILISMTIMRREFLPYCLVLAYSLHQVISSNNMDTVK